ncbi:MAG: type I restriction endonuclease, partial [Thermoanaerobaculia bacterium]|nr:type I restriction endonuclease [Thermoanaerobaculia bacterium]
EVARRGTLDVLRRGVKDSGCRFELAYFRPHSGLNEDLRTLYEANLFAVVRQLRYSERGESSLDVVLFLNGLPLFTAELKNPLTGQNVEHAVRQYRRDRDPREPLFAFGRCLAHFAVDPDQVFVTTHLRGPKTRFLPCNRGWERGAGNPPALTTYATSYLWNEIWSRDSVLNLIQHFIHVVQETTPDGGTRQVLLFPRYHQLDAVRRLAGDARANGAGRQYLIEHSAGSGKSYTIAWLAHWLSVLHDDADERVFDSIVVVTDRRILDRQLQHTISQFEQTLGVVENIDQTSKQLRQALEEGKQIIVTTLQKFPVIVEEIGALAGRRFAVIVDEAHSSQSGESTKALKSVLASATLEEAEEEDDPDETTYEDRIAEEMAKRGRLENASLFAFTATPKPRTLELFGTRRADGKFEAFSLYSMRQAIEEGFILDVLQNYTTYQTWWKLAKKIEDDPRYDKSKAQSLLKSFVDLHPHAIGRKVELMAEHFHTAVAHRIEGLAKAMIVTRSRLHAVRYKLALDAYLKEKGYPYRTLVAFSGTVTDAETGRDHTEPGMNGGVPETRTAATFRQPEYRFLVVANKFQTGFSERLLHTMYVDKRLGGVAAVQTLSRLNRTREHKNETMVVDFANEAGAIEKAFEPYYEATILSEASDPNVLYTIESELLEFGVFTAAEVDGFARLYFGDADQAELYECLRPLRERAEAELDDEELRNLRARLRDFARHYSFLAQVAPWQDADLEKLFVFCRLLRRYLRAPARELPREIVDKIDMDSYRIDETFSGGIELSRGKTGEVEPSTATGRSGGIDETLEPLSEIIRELNERFGADLGPEDRITLRRIEDQLRDDESLRLSVENNTEENARLAFETKIKDLLQSLVDTNFKLFKRLNEDRRFSQALTAAMFDDYRRRIATGGVGLDDVLREIAGGESKMCELKSTLRRNLHTGRNDDEMTHGVLKTIAAFQNTGGGVLYIGVDDAGGILGIDADGFPNADKFLLHLNRQIANSMGRGVAAAVEARIFDVDGKSVCRVACPPATKAVYLKFKNRPEAFFVRTGPASEPMDPSELSAYLRKRFGE